MSGIDLDRLERVLERRGMLLDAATFLLVNAAAQHRPFTPREQDDWDYATATVDELGTQADSLVEYLTRRRQYPRAHYWIDGDGARVG